MKHNILRGAFVAIAACFGGMVQPMQTMAQTASGEIVLSLDKIKFDGLASTKEVKVLKGKNFELFNACDWMTCTYNKKSGMLEISVKGYDFFYPRKTCVVLTSKKTNYSKVIEIVQTDTNTGRPEVVAKAQGENLAFLTDMDLSKAKVTWMPEMYKNLSSGKKPIRIKGSRYENGVSTHAPAEMHFLLNGAKRFKAVVGIDDEMVGSPEYFGHAEYEAVVDGKKIASGRFNLLDNMPIVLDLDVAGGKCFSIYFKDCGSDYGDHISLGNARFETNGVAPVMVSAEDAKAK